jgi:hypothetical protein
VRWRGHAASVGHNLGEALWITMICTLLVADFLVGFVLGVAEGIAALHKAIADERKRKAAEAGKLEKDKDQTEGGRSSDLPGEISTVIHADQSANQTVVVPLWRTPD